MKRGVLGICGLVLIGAAVLLAVRSRDRQAAVQQPEPPAERDSVDSFELIAEDGSAFRSDDLAGQVWVASFFFANCAGECITLNQNLARVQEELKESLAGSPVRFVSISVDPEWDTVERLAEYSERIGADSENWKFLTGSMESIQRAAFDGFGVSVALRSHTDRLIVVDRQGRIRGRYHGTRGAELEQLKSKLAEVVKEPA